MINSRQEYDRCWDYGFLAPNAEGTDRYQRERIAQGDTQALWNAAPGLEQPEKSIPSRVQ